MEEFGRRFIRCNPPKRGVPAVESVVTLAFAAMLLNTDLHSPSLKPDKKMTSTDFIQNLRGVDGGRDFDTKLLKSIYKGIKKKEFSSGADHVLQTQIIQRSLVSSSSIKSPLLAEHHRRLVCLCRLYEVTDLNSRKETDAVSHPRDIFLFNDLLVVTKAVNQQHGGSFNQDQEEPQQQYGYRDSFHLTGLEVTLFHTPVFHYGIQIGNKGDAAAEQVLLTLNAGSEHDRYKFVMDLQESIFEMDLMNRVLNEISSSSSWFKTMNIKRQQARWIRPVRKISSLMIFWTGSSITRDHEYIIIKATWTFLHAVYEKYMCTRSFMQTWYEIWLSLICIRFVSCSRSFIRSIDRCGNSNDSSFAWGRLNEPYLCTLSVFVTLYLHHRAGLDTIQW